ncbi:MAG: hydrogenase nickel incorporation protein HypB [Jatrophihabitans sp.]|uniref:hydrogenase nickel incorporation protein HypB n=1 Tax=Jatrophihabitans sp. TaxID=1932789 RepID=UPI0039103E67
MCATCGCGDPAGVRVLNVGETAGHRHDPDHPHDHAHPHDHPHDHAHPRAAQRDETSAESSRTIAIEQAVLAKNDELANRNRAWLANQRITSVNLMSSPGSGKTTLLERTIGDLSGRREVSVIEGDQETTLDADRIRATGCPVVQINTGSGCHLDADMLARGLHQLAPGPGSLLFIENVGNLVCPALFDLGEGARVVVISVTEGDDKPLKYPHMFAAADVVVVNKTDLLDYVEFDVDRCAANARLVNPRLRVFPVSATKGDGLDRWYEWLTNAPSSSSGVGGSS